MGLLDVPGGSTNVVPGRCRFSLDIRATTNAARDRCTDDVLAELRAICARRGVHHTLEETVRAAAAPSAPAWQQRWEAAVQGLGLPIFRMPSGAGHDAMKLHEVMPQAMLFVRGINSGISHNPLEMSTNDDMQLAVEAFQRLLDNSGEREISTTMAFVQALNMVLRDKAEWREKARLQLVEWFALYTDAQAVSRGRRYLGMYLN